MYVTVFYVCWLFLTVSPFPWSCCMSLWTHRVAKCLTLSPMVVCCLSLSLWFHGDAACISFSSMLAGCL